MAFQKPSPPPVPLAVPWSDEYPAGLIPEGLRHEEVRSERSVDGKLTIPCKIYRWNLVVARWNHTSKEWELCVGTAFAHRRLDNGGEVYSGVHGSWNQALDRKLWRRWGPLRWCLIMKPVPIGADERKDAVDAQTEPS